MMEENKLKVIDQELRLAYKNALYRVLVPAILFKIGEQNDALGELLSKHKSKAGYFITSFNPQSKIYSSEKNENNHIVLREKLLQKKHIFYEGQSEDSFENWPIEKSFLILNILQEDALELGQVFNQKAIVFINKVGNSELLYCV